MGAMAMDSTAKGDPVSWAHSARWCTPEIEHDGWDLGVMGAMAMEQDGDCTMTAGA